MKAAFLVTGIVLLICCAEFHSAEGQQVQGELPKKVEVAAKEKAPEKALESTVGKPEETAHTKPKKAWSFKLGGELTNYFISESRAFYSDHERH